MAINYYSENVSVPNFKRREITKWITEVAATYGKRIGNVSYLFCDDEMILEMNQKYLDHDYYTDIITFEQSVDDIIFADLIISIDTVKSNAKEYEQIFHDELLRVIIHGILHMCGEDDKSDEAKVRMRAAEAKAIAMLPEDKSTLWRK